MLLIFRDFRLCAQVRFVDAEETTAQREKVLTERFVRHLSFGRSTKERKEPIMENKQDKGFTLVELLIVIVILGILATVTVFAVRGITDRGQDNACSVEQRTLDTAIEAYYADNQSDSADSAALGLPAEIPGTADWTFSSPAPRRRSRRPPAASAPDPSLTTFMHVPRRLERRGTCSFPPRSSPMHSHSLIADPAAVVADTRTDRSLSQEPLEQPRGQSGGQRSWLARRGVDTVDLLTLGAVFLLCIGLRAVLLGVRMDATHRGADRNTPDLGVRTGAAVSASATGSQF